MTPHTDVAVLVMSDHEPPDRAQVARWLRERLDAWLHHEAARVGVVAGELLDNSWRHGHAPYILEPTLDPVNGIVAVGALNRPAGHVADWRPGTGLLLVDALSPDWGVESCAEVWAELHWGG